MKTMKDRKTTKAKAATVRAASGEQPKKGKRSQAKGKDVMVVDSSNGITYEKIARRAWSIWMSKDCVPGQDETNWHHAEMELHMEERGD